jgi:hypothetical protein
LSFACFKDPLLCEDINRFGESKSLAIFVGAGASVEARLPAWRELLARLLRRAYDETDQDKWPLDEEELKGWVSLTLERDSVLDAAAIVKAMAGESFNAWISDELFKPFIRERDGEQLPPHLVNSLGPDKFMPGEMAYEVASICRAFGSDVEIVTTNYDDLLEVALMDSGITVTPRSLTSYPAEAMAEQMSDFLRQERDPDAQVTIWHLHGFHGRSQVLAPLILDQADYQRTQRGDAPQERLMRHLLDSRDCLFVGASLTDPNLVRYLYNYDKSLARHRVALFCRQSDAEVPQSILGARERAVSRRWRDRGVAVRFVDHYTDLAQSLNEIAMRRLHGRNYIAVDARAQTWLQQFHSRAVEDSRFFIAQQEIATALAETRDAALSLANDRGVTLLRDDVGLQLWLASPDGSNLDHWFSCDRIQTRRQLVLSAPIAGESPWVVVGAYCAGNELVAVRDLYASRWRYIHAQPLIFRDNDNPSVGRLVVGCMTFATRQSYETDGNPWFAMDPERKTAFDEVLYTGCEVVLQLGFPSTQGLPLWRPKLTGEGSTA